MNLASTNFWRIACMLGFLCAILFSMNACSNQQVTVLNSSDEKVGHYVEGILGNWGRLNPLFGDANPVDNDIARLVFAGLVRIASDGSVVSDMAYMPKIDKSRTVYTFTLKKDLKWHDGTSVTSRDVAFTIQQISDPDFRGSENISLVWRSVEVEVLDESTIVFQLEKPFSPFLARFATIGILPEHLLRGLSSEDLFNAPFNAFPVGSGPYRIDKVTPSGIHFSAWGNYHFGSPQMEKLEFRFYQNFSNALRDIEKQLINSFYIRGFLSLADYEKVSRLKNVELFNIHQSGALVLSLNIQRLGYFDDYRVRKAFSLVIDRSRIAETIFFGRFRPSVSFVAPYGWAYDPAQDLDEFLNNVGSSYQQDLKLAKQLLTDAGWHEHPTTGIRMNDKNEQFNFIIRTDHDPARSQLALEIAKHLELLGIRASVATTPFKVLLRDFLIPSNYDAALTVIDPGSDPDPYFFLHSSQILFSGLNISNFANLSVDKLIERGRDHMDTNIRLDVYGQLQELWNSEVPAIVIGYPMDTYIRPLGGPSSNGYIAFSSSDRFFDIHLWPN